VGRPPHVDSGTPQLVSAHMTSTADLLGSFLPLHQLHSIQPGIGEEARGRLDHLEGVRHGGSLVVVLREVDLRAQLLLAFDHVELGPGPSVRLDLGGKLGRSQVDPVVA